MQIIHRPTADAVAEALAEDIFVDLASQGTIHIGISGGSTPRTLFELLASERFAPRIQWANIQLYWVDERCVPPTDSESNYGMTYQAMLSSVPLPERQIHRIRGEESPSAEAERYTTLVRGAMPTNDKGLPIFDVLILGIGDDGHTSSIFPDQMHLLEEETPYVVATHPTTGQKRICLTGQSIIAARRLIFHAVGANKGLILKAIQSQSPESKAYPASYIARHRPDTELYSDQLEA